MCVLKRKEAKARAMIFDKSRGNDFAAGINMADSSDDNASAGQPTAADERRRRLQENFVNTQKFEVGNEASSEREQPNSDRRYSRMNHENKPDVLRNASSAEPSSEYTSSSYTDSSDVSSQAGQEKYQSTNEASQNKGVQMSQMTG